MFCHVSSVQVSCGSGLMTAVAAGTATMQVITQQSMQPTVKENLELGMCPVLCTLTIKMSDFSALYTISSKMFVYF